jgi:hypothetical protein
MTHPEYDDALKRLEHRLPRVAGDSLRYFLDSSPWMRIPPAIALVVGGTFSFLPVLGLWMLPLGLVLIAQDVPPLRGPIARAIHWADRKWPEKDEAK